MANTNNKQTAISSVCRVDKKKNFTVMNNQHLRSPHLSLKATGLLSKVLSLPEGWDFSVAGLTSICKEGKQAVMTALDELKEWGYLEITKLTPDKTKSGRIEYVYTFYEHSDKDVLVENITDSNIQIKSGEQTVIHIRIVQNKIQKNSPLYFRMLKFSLQIIQPNQILKIKKRKINYLMMKYPSTNL